MTWWQWTVLAVVAVPAAALLAIWLGALLSLDRRRPHARYVAGLPAFEPAARQPDGEYRLRVRGLEFRARMAQGGSGDPVILLHGFPQTSAAWAPLMDALAGRGHRVLAYDQRGISPGARPPGIDAYAMRHLVGDVLAIADAAGFDRFHLVGHDWGAAVGWDTVLLHPDRVLSWSALSIAHPLAFGEALRTDRDQQRRSRYILLFRRPWLAEAVLGFGRLRLFRRVMYRHMPAEHVAEYLRVYSEPGALSGFLNWYRAMTDRAGTADDPVVRRPVLFIWGNRDPAAGRRAVELQAQYLEGPVEVVELDAGHWLVETRTDAVVDRIVRHVAAHGAAT